MISAVFFPSSRRRVTYVFVLGSLLTGQYDPVEGCVGLPVSAPVQPVPAITFSLRSNWVSNVIATLSSSASITSRVSRPRIRVRKHVASTTSGLGNLEPGPNLLRSHRTRDAAIGSMLRCVETAPNGEPPSGSESVTTGPLVFGVTERYPTGLPWLQKPHQSHQTSRPRRFCLFGRNLHH